jgi:mono/diheme cytochrome c family protein
MLERSSSTRFAAAFIIALGAVSAFAADREDLQGISKPSLERGRYIAQIAGCNDCHTPNYAQSGGRVPEKDWLIGDRLGWRGPWGTTYPANLRMTMARMSEEDWVRVARSAQYRPPMPWFALRDMKETDLRALYRFVRSLGVAGEPAPAYVPPGKEPHGGVVQFPMPPQ